VSRTPEAMDERAACSMRGRAIHASACHPVAETASVRERVVQLGEARRGLYERIDTPRRVRSTPEFAEAMRRESHATLLKGIVEQALRENEASRDTGG
jgi:hypothetical protein